MNTSVIFAVGIVERDHMTVVSTLDPSVACYQVLLPGLQMVGLSPCRPQSLPDCQSSAAGVLPIELRAFAPVVVVLASCPLVLTGNEVSPALIG